MNDSIRIKKRTLQILIVGVLIAVAALIVLAGCGSLGGQPSVSEAGGGEAAPEEGQAAASGSGGGESAGPTSTPDQALPAPPGGIWADHVAVYDILVGWQDNSDNEDGFNIYRRRTDLAGEGIVHAGTVGTDVTEFVDGDVWCGGTYQY
ncbi:MAG TPA: hypothetical protein ENI95_05040, partial [Chloroflexi bacterium]|nr:hypothetical protein [Chloroflexota bacterium]